MELEDVEDARILLGRAVECVLTRVDMWLALRGWRRYENARRVLNQAARPSPRSRRSGSRPRLEEAHGHGADLVDRMSRRRCDL